ncbi:MAG: hypothetical protein ACOVQA_11400 [Thermoflexibacteraceae bacterium]|jgi:hypothetical protein
MRLLHLFTICTFIVIFYACNSTKEAPQVLAISEVYIAKDKDGKVGEKVAVVPATDNTFHCVVQLNKKEAGAKLLATLIAIEAEGGFENYEVRALEAVTDSLNQEITFPFSLARPWQKGTYKCDIQLNEKTTTTVNFSIQ